MADIPERIALALGHVSERLTAAEKELAGVKAEVSRAEVEIKAAIADAKPKGPVQQATEAVNRVRVRQAGAVVVLLLAIAAGGVGSLYGIGAALHAYPELRAFADHVWPATSAGGTTPTTGVAP